MTVPPQAGCYKLQIFSFPFFTFPPHFAEFIAISEKLPNCFLLVTIPYFLLVITAQYCAYFTAKSFPAMI